MKQLLNTLFVTSEDIYLSLEGENVLANRDKTVVARYPLHTLQAIVSFSYAGASPALMGKCAEAGIGLAFCSPHGRFLARTCGESSGNVLLRREQYRAADDPARSCAIACTMIFGKLSNGAASIQRTLRDHAPRVAGCGLEDAAANIRAMLPQVLAAADLDSLRGIEGAAATAYFSVLDHMLLSRKEAFFFHGRSRRPPLDRVNAMLSFAYSLLAHDCASALESVGLDSYVGFLHRDRPGRQSLALDLMEELRPCMADRFVLTLVNNRMLRPEDFQVQDSGAVLLSDEGRRKFLKTWQERKRDTLTHPYLGEKLSWVNCTHENGHGERGVSQEVGQHSGGKSQTVDTSVGAANVLECIQRQDAKGWVHNGKFYRRASSAARPKQERGLGLQGRRSVHGRVQAPGLGAEAAGQADAGDPSRERDRPGHAGQKAD